MGNPNRGGNDGSDASVTPAQAAILDRIGSAASYTGSGAESGFDKFMSAVTPLFAAGGVGAIAAPALVGSLGAIGGSAATGALTGASGAMLTGKNIGKAALTGAVVGGIGGAVAPATGALSKSFGLPSYITSGIVKGGLGAAATHLFGSSPAHPAAPGTATATQGGGVNYLGAGALGAGALGAGALSGVGGQGNNGNMASTDTTLAGTITGALPGVLQGAAGVYGSQNAAEKMTQADQNAIGTQQSTLGNINNIWGQQQTLGQRADVSLGAALGTSGKPADYSGFENMPGYKFAVQQGTQAIQRQAASMGNAYTPNTSEAVGQYVTGTAMQDYNTYINQLMGAAGLGSTANAGKATPTYQTGANISQLQQNQGYAQASGVSGAANAVGGMFGPNGVGSSLIGAAGRYLNGGAGGGGGSIGSPVGGGNMYQGALGNDTSTGVGNGAFGSGVDPTTGQAWTNGGSIPSFDPNSVVAPVGSAATDFGGGLDYGSDFTDSGFNFLGGP